MTTSSLPSGKLHKSYSHRLSATGGDYPYYQWTISHGALPKGLQLNVATGHNCAPGCRRRNAGASAAIAAVVIRRSSV